ncbi:hypothetical protein [Hymenobacter cheonanensis]|uniref:hypothetical protein n=1 Tax=Hymenobacter sp. CA2-7 TaxID=3063993 RepID=UPI00271401BD|nr:hypothetical protein [Hymenobacter sp. CA2-7]MDO7885319.1 hypothetical protein [Hymenobacter sp. CA2-7]
MHINTDPVQPLGKPCIRDFHQLTTTLLPAALVMLVPLPELERRAQEIDATHPHFREETPVVIAIERKRRHTLNGLRVTQSVGRNQVA